MNLSKQAEITLLSTYFTDNEYKLIENFFCYSINEGSRIFYAKEKVTAKDILNFEIVEVMQDEYINFNSNSKSEIESIKNKIINMTDECCILLLENLFKKSEYENYNYRKNNHYNSRQLKLLKQRTNEILDGNDSDKKTELVDYLLLLGSSIHELVDKDERFRRICGAIDQLPIYVLTENDNKIFDNLK